MVRQVKTIVCLVAILLLVGGFATRAQAATYDIYDGNPSNTYIQYFKDLLPSIELSKNYVAFRSGQYEYTMVVGDIVYNNGLFTSDGDCQVYTITQNSNYNGYYTYNNSIISSFVLDGEDKILYSDLGVYPQLEERGQKYEILTTILFVAVIVGYVFKSICHSR